MVVVMKFILASYEECRSKVVTYLVKKNCVTQFHSVPFQMLAMCQKNKKLKQKPNKREKINYEAPSNRHKENKTFAE